MNRNGKINLILLIDSLAMGGAERLLVTYLQHFDQTRFNLRVCALSIRQGNPIGREIEKMGIPVDLVAIPNLRTLSGLPRLVRYLKAQQADIVHTQLQFSDALGSMAARIAKIPAVSTLHTFHGPARSRSSLWRRKFTWWSLRHFSHRIIAVSNGARQHYLEATNIPPGQIVTMYNGIDLARFAPLSEADHRAKRAELGIPPNVPLLITVAVLRPPKGIQFLIEALPAMLADVPNLHYLIVGDGDHGPVLQETAAAQQVTGHVIFAGSRSDIPALLDISSLFVLPTLDDALPTVLMEAMAARRPIVASRVGGVPEMVTHQQNGLLVEPGRPAELAEACLQILQNSQLAQTMGHTGRAIAEEKFNIRRQVQQLSNLYLQSLRDYGKELA